MQLLKQSTAITLKIGPFIDDTDGKTAETTLTIAQADVRLSKNGGNIAQKTEATSCTHDELGIYGCPIDATDTATLGRLQLWVHESGALPVWHEYIVVTANVYDSLCSTDILQADLTQIGGAAQSATDLKDFADAGYDPGTNKVEGVKLADTTTTNTDMVGTNGANTTVPDAAGVAPTAAEIKTEVEQAGSSLAQILADTNELELDWKDTGRLDNLLDAIPTTAMRGTDGANTTVPDAAGVAPTAAEIKTAIEAAGSSLAQILADTNELELDWKDGGRLDLLLDAIPTTAMRGTDGANTTVPDAAGVAPTAAEIKTAIEAAGSSLAQILADTGTTLPARFTGVEGATFDTGTDSLEAIRDRGDAAWSAAAGTPSVLIDTTIAVVTDQTHFTLTAGSDVDDAYKDQAIVLYDASNSDYPSVRKCSAYTGATKTVTLDSAPDFTIIAGDGAKTFVTAPRTTAPTTGQVADAVWDEAKADHPDPTTFGGQNSFVNG